MWVCQFSGNGTSSAARHRACLTGLPPPRAFMGEHLSGVGQTFAFVQHWRFWGSGSSLLVHQPVSLWSGFAYFRAVRPEAPCVNRQLRSKRCLDTMEGD